MDKPQTGGVECHSSFSQITCFKSEQVPTLKKITWLNINMLRHIVEHAAIQQVVGW